ncbi:GTP-binding protein [Aliiglaciecola sp. 2_MG-2023]|uniref:CobW family GTP-binding protein n=1 Tax=unclassified Aliiglaciecola TaxID=2593648 RepID=UPI0026E34C2B|nr:MULTISPECIES: GTP-binding protein [unclassified Aliiglaciecola]MDO6711712.1 GTP-binding protein [Aliiglaciecola sp. 2_MG-2023]MDO6752783.1 GTP-binding protein [Aliiglaciecola sp. 1_MG-2023]
MHKIEYLPTNIITGALGVGKTTLIQSLLKQKPKEQRWAVLVNEFGEVGVDGALLTSPEKNGVFIKEVPGGCMCCTSGVPMKIALNVLLAKAKPHRLLIEPTGLGHPKEVLATLTCADYRDVLDVHATLGLIDARRILDQRWRAHKTFQEQLQTADYIVATKSDLYDHESQSLLASYLSEIGVSTTPIVYSDNGIIDPILLYNRSRHVENIYVHQHNHPAHSILTPSFDTPKVGSIKVENSGEGYFSCGWICAHSVVFDYQQIMDTLSGLDVERLKAVFITQQGALGCNYSDGVLRITEIDSAKDSRIEFLTQDKQLAEQTSKILETSLGLNSVCSNTFS